MVVVAVVYVAPAAVLKRGDEDEERADNDDRGEKMAGRRLRSNEAMIGSDIYI